MMETVKKGFYLGLGLASLTKEKVEEFASEFAARAKLNEEEGRKFADFLQGESKKARESLKENVEGIVQAAVKRLPCERRAAQLEARIAALEAAVGIRPAADTCSCVDSPKAPADPESK